MVKDKQIKSPQVLIFVEGDTDEVFFKALIKYYATISSKKILPCDICNLRGVTRYTSKLLAKLRNEYMPTSRRKGYRIKTVCCSYDTDVFEVKQPQIVDWTKLNRSVKRMGVEEFIHVKVRSSIEDWILDDLQGVCEYLHIKKIPNTLKGADGYHKLLGLYSNVRKTYKKGYETTDLINSLDFNAIRSKRADALAPLENALGVNIQQ